MKKKSTSNINLISHEPTSHNEPCVRNIMKHQKSNHKFTNAHILSQNEVQNSLSVATFYEQFLVSDILCLK